MNSVEYYKQQLITVRANDENKIYSLIQKIKRAKREKYFSENLLPMLSKTYTVIPIQNGYKIKNGKNQIDYYPLGRRMFNIPLQGWVTISRNSWILEAITNALNKK